MRYEGRAEGALEDAARGRLHIEPHHLIPRHLTTYFFRQFARMIISLSVLAMVMALTPVGS